MNLKERGELYHGVTPLPGYHLFTLLFGIPLGGESIGFYRIVGVLISVSFAIAFFYAAKVLCSTREAILKSAQAIFFPLLFPLLFLVYTDAFSTTCVLGAFYLLFSRRHLSAGLLGSFSVFVRQNNCIWLLFFMLYIFLEQHNARVSREYLKDVSTIILGLLGFAIFVIINGGVAVGVSHAHPTFSLHSGNVYFLLFSFSVLFTPLIFANALTVVTRVSKKPLLLLPGLLGIIYCYAFTAVDYPFNDNELLLRNSVLHYFYEDPLRKILFGTIAVFSAYTIAFTELKNRFLYLLYPLSFLYLVPSWIVDPRYHILPMLLFTLFREESSKTVETALLVIWIFASLLLSLGYQSGGVHF